MIKLITESFDDDYIKNTRKHMSDREAEKYIKKILRDNSIDLHDYHGNVGGIGWICIETYERGLPDGWQFTDRLTGISAYIDLDGNILRRYNDLETVYSDKYYRSQGGTRDIPESIRLHEAYEDKLDGYAVQIHDMGKGYVHLALFDSIEDAESAYKTLKLIRLFADDDGYESDEHYYTDIENALDLADEIVNEIDWRKEVDKDDIWTAADDTRYQIIGEVPLYVYW